MQAHFWLYLNTNHIPTQFGLFWLLPKFDHLLVIVINDLLVILDDTKALLVLTRQLRVLKGQTLYLLL